MLVSGTDLIGISILLVSSMLVLTLAMRRVYVLEQQARAYRSVIRELRA
jgi:hypothetical protein